MSTTGTANWRARFIAVTVSLSELKLANVRALERTGVDAGQTFGLERGKLFRPVVASPEGVVLCLNPLRRKFC